MSKETSEKGLWAVYPKNDPDYEMDSDNPRFTGPSEDLKREVKKVFNNVLLLDEIFQDLMSRQRVNLLYRLKSFFGYRNLKVKVRLPEKPNIYYVNSDWKITGDYYIDPVEVWWSQYGKDRLKYWKESGADIQRPTIDNDDILRSIREQQERMRITVPTDELKEKLLKESEYIHDNFDGDIKEINTLAHLHKNPSLIVVKHNEFGEDSSLPRVYREDSDTDGIGVNLDSEYKDSGKTYRELFDKIESSITTKDDNRKENE